MSTRAYSGVYYGTNGGGMKFFVVPVIVICLFSFAFIVIQLNLHSVASHANESEAVKQACGHNPLGTWKNETKFYRICGLPDGSFGIQVLIKNIDGTYREVTSYIRKTSGKPVLNFYDVVRYIEEGCKATFIP